MPSDDILNRFGLHIFHDRHASLPPITQPQLLTSTTQRTEQSSGHNDAPLFQPSVAILLP
jgi:hypothetical protein